MNKVNANHATIAPVRKTKRGKRHIREETLAGYLFLAPNIMGFLAFTAFPVAASLILSFFSWKVMSPPKFTGLDNFKTLFLKDPEFWRAIRNTVYYVGVYVPANVLIAIILALWLTKLSRGTAFFRTAFFLPVLAPTVAAAFIWKIILEPEAGMVNTVLGWFHITGPNWLGDPKTAMLGIILMSVWKQVGYNMVIFIAGIHAIPKSLYEAAKIDGADAWNRFRHITLPLLSPSLFLGIILTLISSFQVFDQAFIMTGGGPVNATSTIVMYIYKNGFEFFKMGYAAAIAWVLFAVIFLITVLQMKIQKRWVHYD